MVWKQLQRQLTRSRCSNCTDNNICLWKLDYILCQQKYLLIPQTAFRKEISSRQAATLTSSKLTEWASNTWNLLNTVGYPLMVRLFYIVAFVIRNGIGPCKLSIIKKSAYTLLEIEWSWSSSSSLGWPEPQPAQWWVGANFQVIILTSFQY